MSDDGLWQTDGTLAGARSLVSASALNADAAVVGNHLLGVFESDTLAKSYGISRSPPAPPQQGSAVAPRPARRNCE